MDDYNYMATIKISGSLGMHMHVDNIEHYLCPSL